MLVLSLMAMPTAPAVGGTVTKAVLDGNGPWLRVTTRLESSQTGELQSLADRFAFSQRAEWSYSPSVGGFNPDAQYKAPLILVQSKRLAFGIVPHVGVLNRDTLRLCHHALVANGITMGTYTNAELEKGIAVSLKKGRP